MAATAQPDQRPPRRTLRHRCSLHQSGKNDNDNDKKHTSTKRPKHSMEPVCLRRTCVVPTLVTPLAWQMLARCATLTEVAQLSRMMGCKLRSQWHTNWVSQYQVNMSLCSNNVLLQHTLFYQIDKYFTIYIDIIYSTCYYNPHQDTEKCPIVLSCRPCLQHAA